MTGQRFEFVVGGGGGGGGGEEEVPQVLEVRVSEGIFG